jgi:hypothetical protein
MANNIDPYNPIFYAQEALIILTKQLGMAGRVHRGYDKSPQQRGDTIQIRKPGTFVAQNAPGSLQDIAPEKLQIVLDQWKEVKFGLTDKDLTATGEVIINDHIFPAAYALADAIDQALADLYKFIPWNTGAAGTTPSNVSDITGARKVLFNNQVPLVPGLVHLMIDGNAEEKFLQLAAFSQQQGAGDVGVNTQLRGSLGMKFGLEPFANQNVKTHTMGTASTTTLAINGAHTKGVAAINLDAVAVTGTLVAGDQLVIAGNTQRYAVTGGPYTAAGNAFANVGIFPNLAQAHADNDVVTLTLQNGVRNLGFHRNAFALAMAPLSEMGDGLGARIATIADPVTQLALRARVWYDADNSGIRVGLDVLYGTKALDANLAVNLLG